MFTACWGRVWCRFLGEMKTRRNHGGCNFLKVIYIVLTSQNSHMSEIIRHSVLYWYSTSFRNLMIIHLAMHTPIFNLWDENASSSRIISAYHLTWLNVQSSAQLRVHPIYHINHIVYLPAYERSLKHSPSQVNKDFKALLRMLQADLSRLTTHRITDILLPKQLTKTHTDNYTGLAGIKLNHFSSQWEPVH